MHVFSGTIFESALDALVELLLNFGDGNQIRQFISLTYTGISEGALLALIALGLVLIFKSTDVINFAHGEFMVLGAYIAYEMLTPLVDSNVSLTDKLGDWRDGSGMVLALLTLGIFYRAAQVRRKQVTGKTDWSKLVSVFYVLALLIVLFNVFYLTRLIQDESPPSKWWSLIMACIVMVVIGVLVEQLILRRLIGEPVISVIMVTIGLSSIIRAVVGAYWGISPYRLQTAIFPGFFNDLMNVPEGERAQYRLEIEGARRPLLLEYENLYTIFIVILLLILFMIFFRRSKEGIAMRAAADDQQAAMSMGISISRVFAFAWSIAAFTAGVAGIMVANLTQVSGDINSVGLRAFPVIILGGLDSIPGAIVGGLVIGLIEQYTSAYIDPSLKNVIPYIVLIVVLMIRPYGLFGQKIIERV
ncbi:MAG: branched-chain amino acid ABC transporter permease [Anaerolineae bacterium]|nr:branched-chain amino acid ABC transporter permease [Anaerolineae bacterium]